MGLTHDLTALVAQRQRPRYGRELRFAGLDLPDPEPITIVTRHGGVRCLRYAGTTGARYVHFHGGAFVTRYPEMDDFWARFVVASTGLEAVLPDYDVAPQARYPVAHDEAYDLTCRLAADAVTIVGGFSGGGNLAASVALRSVLEDGPRLAGQLLGVPSTDVADDIDEKCRHAPTSMIGPRLLTLVRKTYFKDATRRANRSRLPSGHQIFGSCPPPTSSPRSSTPLRREGDAYAQRLAAAGVTVEHQVAAGVDHYFLHGAGAARARALMTQMAEWLAATARRAA